MACHSPWPVDSLPAGAGLTSLPACQPDKFPAPWPDDRLLKPTVLTQWKPSNGQQSAPNRDPHLTHTWQASERPVGPQARRALATGSSIAPNATAQKLLRAPSLASFRSLADPPCLPVSLVPVARRWRMQNRIGTASSAAQRVRF